MRNKLTGVLLLILLGGCYSDYHRKVKSELASGIRQDSLFLGLTFGMTRNEFFEHCWDLNRQQLVFHSSRNDAVLYPIKDFKFDAKMEFYPNFHEDRIYEMPVYFEYMGWAPWSKMLYSDSLIVEVSGLIEKWYGPDFLKVERSGGEYALVKVDGNRRILITKQDERKVKVLFTDLTHDEEESHNHEQAHNPVQ